MVNIKYILFTFCIVINSISAQKHNFIHFGVDEGLSESHVYAICEDSLGYLYIGTDGGGLSQFDGKSFKNFTFKDGIKGNSVFGLYNDLEGNIWVSTNRGATFIHNGIPKTYTKDDGLISNNVWTAYSKGPYTWIGTELGLNILKNGKIISCNDSLLNSSDVFSIAALDTSNVWFGTKNGLVFYDGTKYRKKDFPSSKLNNIKIYSLNFDNNNNLWIASANGLFKLYKNSLEEIPNIANPICHQVFIDSKNNVWVATQNGLNKISKDKNQIFTMENGLSNNSVWTIFEDRNQNIWIGTQFGINKLHDDIFTLYDNNSKFKKTWIISQSSNNKLYFGYDLGGAAEFKNGKVNNLSDDKTFNNKSIWSILEDSNRNIWLGSDGGAYIYSNDKIKFFDKFTIPNNESIMSMAEDSKGNFWFATFWNGLYKYDGKQIKHFTVNEGLYDNSVYAIYKDKKGIIWIGTDQGLNYYKDDSLYKYQEHTFLTEASVMSITGSENDLWIGTYGTGVVQLASNNKFRIFNESNGLNNNTVLFLNIDQTGSIWVGTNRGLNKIFKLKNDFSIQSWTKNDGVPGIETVQNSSCITNNNMLWYGSVKGIVSVDLNKLNNIQTTKSTLILKDIKIFFNSIFENNKNILYTEIPTNFEFHYDQNSLVFEYIDINLSDHDKVKYRTKLEGFNKHWSILSNNPRTIYSNLPSGSYKFVAESSSDNFNSSNRIEQKFLILTPFWKTWWFYTIIVLTLLVLTYVLYYLRVRTLYKYNLKLRENIEARKEYEKKLEQSEKSYREVFEHAHSPILIIDPNSHLIIDANISALTLYGYTKKEIETLSISDLAIDQQKYSKCLSDIFKSGSVKQFFSDHKTKSGKTINLEINATQVDYKDQKMIMVILMDLTEKEETLKNLEKAKMAAEKSDKMKSEFLAQMSHEIRTPINTIMNYTSLLQMEFNGIKSETADDCFQAIGRGANRLIRTIDLVLNMSDLESGTYEAVFEDTDLVDDILTPIKEEFLSNAKQKGLELIVRNELSKKCMLNIDKYTSTQIFVNLIDNAIKYTHKGKVEAIIYAQENFINVDIADTGIGISEEYIPSLFNKFSQEEQGYTRKFEGNGLGLALVKEYCNINSAEISVKSQKGEGTIFTVLFKRSKSSTPKN